MYVFFLLGFISTCFFVIRYKMKKQLEKLSKGAVPINYRQSSSIPFTDVNPDDQNNNV